VPRFVTALPDRAAVRELAVTGPSLWVWSSSGAYRLSAAGIVLARQPALAPGTGQVYAAAAQGDRLLLLFAEQGFHPVRVAAITATEVMAWSRPYTGQQPRQCRIVPGPAGQLAIRCPDGRLAVRDAAGITRYDEVAEGWHRAALGPRGEFAVAAEGRDRTLKKECRVRRFGETGDDSTALTRPRPCGTLWYDATGRLRLDNLLL
jgi:hypothetical protein